MIFARPARFRWGPWIIVAVLVCLMILMKINTDRTPIRRAERLAKDDPCAAAKMFAEVARGDTAFSSYAIERLCKLEDPCALRELVGLMDVPDSHYLNRTVRLQLWQAVYRKANTYPPALPRYDPDAPLPERVAQKATWEKWIATVIPEPKITRTTTATTSN